MDFKETALQLGIDEDDIHEVVDLFITTAPSDIKKMVEAYNKLDIVRIGEAAHSLKGSTGTLGFSRIAKDAQLIIKQSRENDFEALDLLIPSFLKKMEELFVELKEALRNKKT